MRLQEIDAAEYARDVLPQTAKIWAGKRDLETYVQDWLAIAKSRYGKRHYRTLAMYDNGIAVASFKRYERRMHLGAGRLRAIGIGAVFTQPAYRGRGYATAMLAKALDDARAGGCDAAFLFSDIHPQFYAALGFLEMPSREITLSADSLARGRLAVSPATEKDWTSIARCFDVTAHAQHAGFVRTPLVWNWVRTMRGRYARSSGLAQTNLVVRYRRAIVAYVLGTRDVKHDLYQLDEFGFAGDAGAATIPALLRAAAGDLHRIAGWLPPSGAREALPKGAVRKRRSHVLMMAPLTKLGNRLIATLREKRGGDPLWSTDHV